MVKVEIGAAMRQARLMVRNREMRGDKKEVYERLVAGQRPDGTTQITLAVLKKEVDIGSDQLQRALNWLIETGLILKRRTRVWFAKLGRWVNGPNVYTILPLPSGSQSRGRTTNIPSRGKQEEKANQQIAKSKAGVFHRVVHRVVHPVIPGLFHNRPERRQTE